MFARDLTNDFERPIRRLQGSLQEESRREELATRANVFLSVVTLFLGSLFFNLKAVLLLAQSGRIARYALFGAWGSFFVALASIVISLFVRKFEAPFDPVNVIEGMGDGDVDDGAFFEARMLDMAVTTNTNMSINDRIASWLQLAGATILMGFSCAVLFLIAAALNPVDLGTQE